MSRRKIAFVYAGQGAQKVGMGRDFYEEYIGFREVWNEAEAGFDLKKLCMEGPSELLMQTRYTQPCLLGFAVGVTKLLYDAGIRPEAVAGLSLGEYSALYAAGVLDWKTALRIVVCRGQAMEDAAAGLDCAMVAVQGLAREKLQEACKQAAHTGVVQICNYNYPGQMVIGGERTAVEAAGSAAKSLGAARCVPLRVSGPFHTRLMIPAARVLRAYLDTVEFHQMNIPVYFNCTGGPMAGRETVPALLEQQIYSSVYWEDIMRSMERDDVDTVVEIGPGKTLAGFFRRTVPDIKVYSIETTADFRCVTAELGEAVWN